MKNEKTDSSRFFILHFSLLVIHYLVPSNRATRIASLIPLQRIGQHT